MLHEECSVIIQRKLPPNLEDPDSFTISCTIGSLSIGKALCDLGTSINLMPLSIFNRLGIGKGKPTMMFLQLVDRSIKQPYGIVEEVLIKVDKFIFLSRFYGLEHGFGCRYSLDFGKTFLGH